MNTQSFTPRLQAIFEQMRQKPKSIMAVHLAIGEMIAAQEDEIRTAWAKLANATPLANTMLHIHHIRAEYQCMACFEKYHPQRAEMRCPHCGSFGVKILSGEEFHLRMVEEANE